MKTSNNIVRSAGDTYPSKSRITIGGAPVNLTGWDVDLRYMVGDVEMVIQCVITDHAGGLVSIYPHGRTKEVADAVDSDGNATPRLSPSDYIMSDQEGSNQVWDEDEKNSVYPFYIVRTRSFDGYKEEMTHNSGKIYLNSRYVE